MYIYTYIYIYINVDLYVCMCLCRMWHIPTTSWQIEKSKNTIKPTQKYADVTWSTLKFIKATGHEFPLIFMYIYSHIYIHREKKNIYIFVLYVFIFKILKFCDVLLFCSYVILFPKKKTKYWARGFKSFGWITTCTRRENMLYVFFLITLLGLIL